MSDPAAQPAPRRRMLILADGHLGVFAAKTTVCLLRYCPDEVVAVLDAEHAGESTRALLGVDADVPIVASVAGGLAFQPNLLVIGIAPRGGRLPAAWRSTIEQALDAGLDVAGGLHVFLADDVDLARRAAGVGRRLIDLRRVTVPLELPTTAPRGERPRRVLTVGSDCNVGKMTTAVEIVRAARRRGVDARFAATGQTGILIAGDGIPIDRVIADFVAGAANRLVESHADADWVVVEGQGALAHPAYSAVTLGLLHGVRPHDMILCHHVGRRVIDGYDIPLAGPAALVARYESAAGWVAPGRVAAFALNPVGATDAEQSAYAAAVAATTGLPAADPLADAERLVDAVLAGS